MNKFSQRRGFSAIEGILVIVVVVLLAALGWYIYSRRHTKSTANTSSTTSQSSTNTPTSSADIVQTKTDSKLGAYLADANGMTLYTYSQDKSGVSNCTGSCLTTWPVYKASSSSGSLPAHVSTIKRSDGTLQYAYDGMPLYTFTGDKKAGDVTGNNVEGFKLAVPAASSSSSSSSSSSNNSSSSTSNSSSNSSSTPSTSPSYNY